MSVVAYVGLPGSGKSYGVVKNVLLPALEAGRHVFLNIPLNLVVFAERHPDFLSLIHRFSDDDFQSESFFTDTFSPGAVLILDEAWRHFPSGMSSSKIPEYHRSFFAEHRHLVGSDGLETDIVLVTQDLGQLCNFASLLVETVFQSVKLTAVGAEKKYRTDVYAGRKLVEANKIRSEISSYDPKVFEYYKSHTKSAAVGKKAKVDKRQTIFSPRFIFMLLFGLVAGIGGPIWVVTSISCFFGSEENQESLAENKVPQKLVESPSPGGRAEGDPRGAQRSPEGQPPRPPKPPEDRYFDWIEGGDVFVAYNEPGRERLSVGDSLYSLGEIQSLGLDVLVLSPCLVEIRSVVRKEEPPIFAQCRPEVEQESVIAQTGLGAAAPF